MVESGGSIELVAGDGDTGTGGHMLLSVGLSSASSGAGVRCVLLLEQLPQSQWEREQK